MTDDDGGDRRLLMLSPIFHQHWEVPGGPAALKAKKDLAWFKARADAKDLSLVELSHDEVDALREEAYLASEGETRWSPAAIPNLPKGADGTVHGVPFKTRSWAT